MPYANDGADYNRPTMHLRLKVNGNQTKRELFNYMAGVLDVDFPFAPPSFRVQSVNNSPLTKCEGCSGWPWRMPAFGSEELMRLSWQIASSDLLPGNLKIKIRHYSAESKCRGTVTSSPAPASTPLSTSR